MNAHFQHDAFLSHSARDKAEVPVSDENKFGFDCRGTIHKPGVMNY